MDSEMKKAKSRKATHREGAVAYCATHTFWFGR